jgi:hypothetical protein
MAMCEWCEQERTVARSCSVEALHRSGEPIGMIPWGREFPRWSSASTRCGDCGVGTGGFHHPGCDIQQCPLCRGQMLSCGCRFDEDRPEEDDDVVEIESRVEPLYVDADGDLVERRWVGGQEVIVHHTDRPETDITVHRGIPCTTALRTVIDVAPGTDDEHLDRIVEDCLRRRLFSVEEARARLDEPDMEQRRGAHLLNEALDRFERRRL